VKSQILSYQLTSGQAEQTMHQPPKKFLLLAGGTFLSLLMAGSTLPKQLSLHTFTPVAEQQGK
jgi:hypothetical protein